MEKPREMWPLIISITAIVVGLGSYFGATLYGDTRFLISWGHPYGISTLMWIRLVSHWLIVLGAFAWLASLWRLLRKHR